MDINSSAKEKTTSSETPARPRALSEVLNISIPTSPRSGIPTSPRSGLLSDALGMTRPRAQTDLSLTDLTLTNFAFFSASSSPRARSYSSPKALATERELEELATEQELATQRAMETLFSNKVAFSFPKSSPSPIAVKMAQEEILAELNRTRKANADDEETAHETDEANEAAHDETAHDETAHEGQEAISGLKDSIFHFDPI